MTSKLLIVTLGLLAFIKNGLSICGQCGTISGVMCLTSNSFSPCFGGTVSNTINSCPFNEVCNDSSQICANASTTNVADCPTSASVCNTCSSDNRFACLNSTTFAYCFGGSIPSSMTGLCPTGQFCDLIAVAPGFCSTNIAGICLASTTVPPTTTNTPSTTTPLSTTTPTPSAYCQQIIARQQTRYATPFYSNCRQYVLCFYDNSILEGAYYFCPGSTLFNNITGFCVPSTNFVCPPAM